MKPRINTNTHRWLVQVSRGKLKYILFLILFQVGMSLSSAGYALFLRGIIDNAVSGNAAGLKHYAILLLGLVITQALLRSGYRYVEEYTRSTLENGLKSRLFGVLLTKDYGSVTATHSGEWLNRLTSDVVIVSDGMTQIIPGLIGTVIRMAVALTVLVVLEPSFGSIFLIGGILIVLLTVLLRKRLKQLHRQVQASDGRLRVFLSERLGSLMTVRAFGKENLVLQQGQEHMSAHKAARMKKSNFANLCNTGLALASNGAYALGAIYCGMEILSGRMSYGTFTAVLQLISQTQAPLTHVSGFLPRYYTTLASAERLMEAEAFLQDEAGSYDESTQQFYREQFLGLRLNNISFTYPASSADGNISAGTKALHGLNLQINKGEYVAFTGQSGCGKSTVLKLLMCLYSPEQGERSLLTTMGKLPLTAQWRGLFAYVPQGNQLMNGTIREVITFGEDQTSIDEAAIRRALSIACADQFVSELPDGLDTMLGERGSGLSEGQMQRIAIARAIYSDRPILLLDESTSALDEKTEKMLLSNLRSMTDKTVITITHRPAVLAITDKTICFSEEES